MSTVPDRVMLFMAAKLFTAALSFEGTEEQVEEALAIQQRWWSLLTPEEQATIDEG